jgi:hypothetical protein
MNLFPEPKLITAGFLIRDANEGDIHYIQSSFFKNYWETATSYLTEEHYKPLVSDVFDKLLTFATISVICPINPQDQIVAWQVAEPERKILYYLFVRGERRRQRHARSMLIHTGMVPATNVRGPSAPLLACYTTTDGDRLLQGCGIPYKRAPFLPRARVLENNAQKKTTKEKK